MQIQVEYLSSPFALASKMLQAVQSIGVSLKSSNTMTSIWLRKWDDFLSQAIGLK